MTALLAPLLLLAAGMLALGRGVDGFDALRQGAGEGLQIMARVLPALIALLPAVWMLRASGALDALTALAAPLLERLGVPAETVPLMLLRPFSGSGALAARTAAVMMGSTETTFYVIAVYFGAAGVRKTRHAIPAALCADLTGFLMAAWTTRWFFGG